MKLYELAAEYDSIMTAIEENGGELTPELEAALDANAEDVATKLDNIGAMYKNFEGLAELASIEAKSQTNKARSRGNAAQRLKEYAKEMMKRIGVTKHVGRFDLSVCNNSQVSIKFNGDPRRLPDEFKHVETVVMLDAGKVREAIKNNDPLPDGVTVVRGDHLRIK